jgi:hypothetical protein
VPVEAPPVEPVLAEEPASPVEPVEPVAAVEPVDSPLTEPVEPVPAVDPPRLVEPPELEVVPEVVEPSLAPEADPPLVELGSPDEPSKPLDVSTVTVVPPAPFELVLGPSAEELPSPADSVQPEL